VLIDFTGGDLDTLGPNQPIKAELSAHNADVDTVSVQRIVGKMASGGCPSGSRRKALNRPICGAI